MKKERKRLRNSLCKENEIFQGGGKPCRKPAARLSGAGGRGTLSGRVLVKVGLGSTGILTEEERSGPKIKPVRTVRV